MVAHSKRTAAYVSSLRAFLGLSLVNSTVLSLQHSSHLVGCWGSCFDSSGRTELWTNLRMAFLRRAILRPHFFVRKSSSAHLFVSHYFVSHFFVGAKIRSAFLRIRISSSAHFFVKHFFVHAFLRLRKSSSAFLRPRKSSSPQIFVRKSSSANLRPQIFVRKFSSVFFDHAFLRPIKSSSANLRP